MIHTDLNNLTAALGFSGYCHVKICVGKWSFLKTTQRKTAF